MSGTYDRKDHFYREAKAQGYRSRAAYKLLELNKKFKFLSAGARVLDLGAFPGSWLQVAQEKVGPSGLVVGVDLNPIEPLEVKNIQPQLIVGDATSEAVQAEILGLTNGPVDVVLSDMSPKLSGIRFRDAVRSAELVDASLQIAHRILRVGGVLVAKIFPGSECEELTPKFRQCFSRFSRECLDSSRRTSNEMYFVGIGLKPSATTNSTKLGASSKSDDTDRPVNKLETENTVGGLPR